MDNFLQKKNIKNMYILKKKYFSSHNFKEHFNGKFFKCHCGFVLKSEYKFEQHQKSHISAFKCEVCAKQSASRSSLLEHWNTVHLKTHGKLRIVARSKF